MNQITFSHLVPQSIDFSGESLAPASFTSLIDVPTLWNQSPDSLRKGIWPRSAVLWFAAFWVALFIIRPWEKMFPTLGPLHIARIYALIMIGAILLFGATRLYLSSFQTRSVILFILALMLSSVLSFDFAAAWEDLYVYLTLVAFYFVLLSVVQTPYQLLFMVTCYILAQALYLAKAQVEFFIFNDHITAMGVRRMVGIDITFADPNAVAEATVISLPLALALWRARRVFTETWPNSWRSWFSRGLLLYFWLAMSSVILTHSRAGMLGFAVFVFLVAAWQKNLGKSLRNISYAAAFLLMVWFLMPSEYQDRLSTVWNPEAARADARASAEGRIQGMQAGLRMFQDYPFCGVGLGNFIAYRVTNIDGAPLLAHNLLGQMLGETGLIGAGTFLLMIFAVLWNCRQTIRLTHDHPVPYMELYAQLASAFMQAIVLLVFFGLSLHNMYRFQWLWIAAFSLLLKEFAQRTAWGYKAYS